MSVAHTSVRLGEVIPHKAQSAVMIPDRSVASRAARTVSRIDASQRRSPLPERVTVQRLYIQCSPRRLVL